MIRTKLTERYRIELPFVSAGMGFIALPPLAAAVSNAGGFGQLAAGAAPPEILRELIRATRALTTRPFAVNFIIETIAFGPLATETHLRVCIEERIPAVVFHWAPPPVEWVRMLKEANHSCPQKFSVVFPDFVLYQSRGQIDHYLEKERI